jgi:hypothetical protein
MYQVATMMPNNMEEDPGFTRKKSHVGNCHVTIVFNRSGELWNMSQFQSQLNYVNIVIRPACRGRATSDPDFMPGFYHVQVITKEGFPKLSPAGDPKIISATQLPQFVRVLALNASMFCATWNVRNDDTEFPSNWRARLQQIKALKHRVIARTGVTGTPTPVGAGGRKTPVPRDESGGPEGSRDGALASQLDFSSWTVKDF